MKFILLSLALAATSTVFAEDTDQQVEAHRRDLELAGAFSNDGYKIRDGYWVGKIEGGKDIFLQVNLYLGNSYWFLAAAPAVNPKLEVTVFDESGTEVAPTGTPYSEEGRAAVGIAPTASGPYYVRLRLKEGDPVDVCFLYCYK